MKKEYIIPYTEILKFQESDYFVTMSTDEGDPDDPDGDWWNKVDPDIDFE